MSGRRKRKFAIRFELGLGGLFGLATVCLCIFLWLFLLGVWTGQTVLLPSGGDSSKALSRFANDLWRQGRQVVGESESLSVPPSPTSITSVAKTEVEAIDDDEAEDEPSFFTLQVATFDEQGDAEEEVLSWQARGQDPFFLDPMEGADHYRVFIGHFATLTEANDMVNTLEKDENIQAFITLLPAKKIGR